MERFLYFYENIFSGALTHGPGWAGMAITTRSPDANARVFGHDLDGPRKAIAYHPLLSQLGTRTDAMIDFDALVANEWNVLGLQFLTSREGLEDLFPNWFKGFEKVQPNWREENPGITDPLEVMYKDFFSLVNNHWDVFLDVGKLIWNEGPIEPVRSPDAVFGPRR
jgi:hypothetical protein